MGRGWEEGSGWEEGRVGRGESGTRRGGWEEGRRVGVCARALVTQSARAHAHKHMSGNTNGC